MYPCASATLIDYIIAKLWGQLKILLYALDISTLLSAAKYGLGQHLPAVISTIVAFQKVSG